ncbi:hypothetical protein [Pseudomonas sp. EGD-AK9]|uniref:hypothetical protein n=1 Tax=Pseudomonas sp. EGD-AK9 TaxID=1386078 RepID=UPI0003FB9AED|nr:hypothetical protein [Pseudomonas sp. EGD-AK9]
MADMSVLRRAFIESLPSVDHAGSDPDREPAFTYVPPSHAKALDPDVSVVEGIRGAGKSFWWAQLASEEHRSAIVKAFPEIRLESGVRVTQAFGAQLSSADSPSEGVLTALIAQYPARAIWKAVLAQKAGFCEGFPRDGEWAEKVRWVAESPEAFDRMLQRIDLGLDAKGETLVVLFDALDRLAEDWQHIRPLAKGLLQVALELRSTRRIRFKLFMRPDMLQDKEIIQFPDASKLLARKAGLAWRRADLYALLFQCLANSPTGGPGFRALCHEESSVEWRSTDSTWQLPPALRSDEKLQEQIFARMAGTAMASGPSGYKRGKPYTWLVNHLQDGLDQVSPRSFSSALRYAAEETREDSVLVLDYKAIQAGVREASKIRVNELVSEDYPWVDLVMQPLRGRLVVPCTAQDIERLWGEDGTLSGLQARLQRVPDKVKLPPPSVEPDAVLAELESLGLLQRVGGQRIQMPDVYRLAFGLGRRGGVRPLK